MTKGFFNQALQGDLSPEVMIEACEAVLKEEPEIDRAKLIIKVMKRLKGKTNAAQIAKIIYKKGYCK